MQKQLPAICNLSRICSIPLSSMNGSNLHHRTIMHVELKCNSIRRALLGFAFHLGFGKTSQQ